MVCNPFNGVSSGVYLLRIDGCMTYHCHSPREELIYSSASCLKERYPLPSCKLTWQWKIPVIPGKYSQHGGLSSVSLQGCTLFVRMFKWILRRCNGTPKYWKYMCCLMPRSSILAMLGKNWAAVTGHVRLHVTHTPCLSCVWAMASWFFMMSGGNHHMARDTRWWFQTCFIFTPIWEDSHFN